VKFAQAILYRGAGLDVLWREFVPITVIGAVFFLVALVRFGQGSDPDPDLKFGTAELRRTKVCPIRRGGGELCSIGNIGFKGNWSWARLGANGARTITGRVPGGETLGSARRGSYRGHRVH